MLGLFIILLAAIASEYGFLRGLGIPGIKPLNLVLYAVAWSILSGKIGIEKIINGWK